MAQVWYFIATLVCRVTNQISASVREREARGDCKTVAKANQAVLLDKVSPTGDTKHSSLIATTNKSIYFQSVNDGDRNVIKLN